MYISTRKFPVGTVMTMGQVPVTEENTLAPPVKIPTFAAPAPTPPPPSFPSQSGVEQTLAAKLAQARAQGVANPEQTISAELYRLSPDSIARVRNLSTGLYPSFVRSQTTLIGPGTLSTPTVTPIQTAMPSAYGDARTDAYREKLLRDAMRRAATTDEFISFHDAARRFTPTKEQIETMREVSAQRELELRAEVETMPDSERILGEPAMPVSPYESIARPSGTRPTAAAPVAKPDLKALVPLAFLAYFFLS